MQLALDQLKTKLTKPLVLVFPDFYKPFGLETDAFSVAVGVMLSQKKYDGKI